MCKLAVQDGKIVEAVKNRTLDRAVCNMLQFVSDYQQKCDENVQIDHAANALLSAELEEHCSVLLKNDGILPLGQEEKIDLY